MNDRPNFTTLKSFAVDYGTRNFIEVALKATEDGNHFISISKGYTDQGGNKRYKRSLGFQVDDNVIDFLIEKLGEIKKASAGLPKPEPKAEAPAEEEAPAKK
jgi:hypothetical protein